MTGVDIIGSLLFVDAELLTMVQADRIKAGVLPDGVSLPALLVRLVSSVERQPLRRGATIRTTDRIAVTVRAASYRNQVAIMRRVRDCCAGRTGNIGGAASVAVLAAGTGPDVMGPASSFEQTQDFRVGYDAPSAAANSAMVPALPGGSSGSPVSGIPSTFDGLSWAP